MSTAVALLTECGRLGVQLVPAGDRLRCIARRGAMTPALETGLRAHKTELLRLVGALTEACEGVDGITAAQFMALCTDGDLAAIANGELDPETLHAFAVSFAEGIASGRIRFIGDQLIVHGITMHQGHK